MTQEPHLQKSHHMYVHMRGVTILNLCLYYVNTAGNTSVSGKLEGYPKTQKGKKNVSRKKKSNLGSDQICDTPAILVWVQISRPAQPKSLVKVNHKMQGNPKEMVMGILQMQYFFSVWMVNLLMLRKTKGLGPIIAFKQSLTLFLYLFIWRCQIFLQMASFFFFFRKAWPQFPTLFFIKVNLAMVTCSDNTLNVMSSLSCKNH